MSNDLIDIDIDASRLQGVADALLATQPQFEKALKSTLSRVATWLKTMSAKGLSKELGIQQKIIRRRLRSFKVVQGSEGMSINVWYGLNPIGLIYLQAKQDAGGVRVSGGRYVKGAFIATANGRKMVLKRRGAGRLPVDKQEADIKDKSSAYLEDGIIGAAAFENYFYTVFERELKWRTRILE